VIEMIAVKLRGRSMHYTAQCGIPSYTPGSTT